MNPTPVPLGSSNPPKTALSGGSGGSTFDPMEARVARLEEDVREIKADLKALREEMRLGFKELREEIRALATEVAAVKADVARIEGRLTQIPTIWQVVTLVFGVMGGVFVILKYGLH